MGSSDSPLKVLGLSTFQMYGSKRKFKSIYNIFDDVLCKPQISFFLGHAVYGQLKVQGPDVD